MSLDMTPEQKELGKANFKQVSAGLSRRGFMKTVVAGAAAVPVSAAAYYGYNYNKLRDNPVRAALIGTGDEGGVLAGEHNPRFLKFVAVCDIRPSNVKRIFEGQAGTPRKGLNFHYHDPEEIAIYDDYHKVLADPEIEAVVIALPLHLHAPVAIECMKAGKHVLCEKLMAWNIQQCKQMIDVSEKTDTILTIGHQRHYSMLYAQAVEVMQAGVLGDVKHIRALWHRNNSWHKVDKNGKPIPGSLRDSWRPDVNPVDREALDGKIHDLDYKSMEELVRWRLYNRTGGGLMAELGSHQLDACSIFLGKVHPLAVSGVGGKMFYHDDREVEDHVFVTFEFPGPNYFVKDKNGTATKDIKDKNDIVVVTYSSINTNSFEAYGECVMGTRGTMVVESEQSVMLYGEKDPNLKESGGPRSTSVTVASTASNQPVLDSSGTSGPADRTGPAGAGGAAADAGATGPVSRGYREEMEHFAYCVRMHQLAKDSEEKQKWRLTPRCHGKVAMADAIIALTANQAMKNHQRIEFKEEWFDPKSSEVPDADMKPKNYKGDIIQA